MTVGLYVPCYNASRTLRECLASVYAQSVPPQEVVVVDDGSTDTTASIAREFPVTLLSHGRNQGIAAARNTALRHLRTDMVASLDADCVADPQWLAILAERMKGHDIAGAGGKLSEGETSAACDLWRSVHMPQHWGEKPVSPRFLFGANTLFRRQALEEAGRYNAEYSLNYEDVDMSERLKAAGYSLAYEPRALAVHLRRDTLHTLLTSYWNWNYPYYKQEGFYRGEDALARKVKDVFGLANRCLEEDRDAGREKLYYLDVLLSLHHALKDLQCYLGLAGRPVMAAQEMDQLSFWLSLFDIEYFSRPAARQAGTRTILAAREAFTQNTLALALSMGDAVRRVFPAEDAARRFFQDLVYSLSGVQMPNLSRMVCSLAMDGKRWKDVCSAAHPLLERGFLAQAAGSWEIWVEQLNSSVPGFPGRIIRGEDV